MNTIPHNLQQLQQRIHAAEKEHHRPLGSVSLLAVSKKQPIDKIQQAFFAGQRTFGENYVQEALDKMQELKELAIQWHFIGKVQSNKTKDIALNFAWVHSLDRYKIAKRLNDQRPTHLEPLNVCIEVNIDDEAAKGGINFQELSLLAEQIDSLPQLKLRGLMAIPKLRHDPLEQQTVYAKLRHAYLQLQQQGFELDTLSMGMSQDFSAAIAEGATIVRIGTALFGIRE